MTLDPKALMALAHAYDKEDAAQRGEPDPWPAEGTPPTADDVAWAQERIACAKAGAAAFLSASGAGWRPIATAPKDGTKIQTWADGYEWPEIIYYEKYDDETAAEVGEPGYWRYADDLFADVANIEFDTLTHWMPLPAAPDRRAG